MIQEAKKPKKNKKNIFTAKYTDKEFYNSSEAFDQGMGLLGGAAGTVGGIPGMAAGAAAGYLGSKAVRKAARWLDK